MTRETKVGLVIAGSFLCLVGIVVASKLHLNDGPSTGEPIAKNHAKNEAEPQEEPPKGGEQKKEILPALPSNEKGNTPGGASKKPAAKGEGKKVDATPASPPQLNILPSGPALPPPLPSPPQQEKKKVELLQNVIAQQSNPKQEGGLSKDGFPVMPLPSGPVLPQPPLPMPPAVTPKKPDKVSLPGAVVLPSPPDPNLRENINAVPPDVAKTGVSGAFVGPKKEDGVAAPLPVAPVLTPDAPAQFGVNKANPLPPSPFGGDKTNPLPPTQFGDNKIAPLPAPVNPGVVAPPAGFQPSIVVQPPTIAPMPPMVNDPPMKIVPPFVPAIPKSTGPEATIPSQPGFVQPDVAVQKPLPLISTKPEGVLPSITIRPGAFGNTPPPTANNPPLVQYPETGVQKTSVSFDACQAGETDFKALSRRFYGSEKYADALQAYNRNNSVAVPDGANLIAPAPQLRPGQQVLKPSVSLLERDYKVVEPARILPTANSATPIGVPTPATVTPTPVIPRQAAVPTQNPPTADPTGSYKVSNPKGESILDVAERVLGNRMRWPEIYRLNPTVQPQLPIPYGADLRMPVK